MTGAPAVLKPPPPPAYRWAVLVLTSVAMFGNYYAYDAVAPLASMLSQQLGFTDKQIGTLNAIYSTPNIIMVLIGGIIVDRLGTRRAALCFTAISTVGAFVTATAPSFPVMAAGRLLFGLGSESMIVAVTAALGQWFKGRQLGLAFGLNLSIARAGSYAADLSPSWASGVYATGWQLPLWLAAGIATLGLAAILVYWMVERAASPRYELAHPKPSDRIVWSDLLRFDKSYWYIVGLCVTFYSVIFPFRSTFAIKYFQDAHGLTLKQAGIMNSHVFLAAIFATPLFGLLVDRVGRRSFFMAVGSLVLLPTFLILGYTHWSLWVSTVLIGLSFSLIPAVMWPAVPYVVDERRLGTAYGLMTMVQNIGLSAFNFAAGALNDAAGAGPGHPRGYLPMLWMFGLLSLAGVAFAVALRRREAGPLGHGLETLRVRGF